MDWKTRVLALLLSLPLVLSSAGDGNAEKRIVCYYTNWSVYRPGTAKFSPQNINPYLCTHLIYAFGGFTKDNTLKPFDKYQDIDKGGYGKFTGLKTYNKNLKTMLAIGGWNEGSSRFSPMVADPGRRKEFVKNSVKFLRQNHFDGLDLDWEYPAFRDGGKSRDRNNYADLVQELREEFDRESSKTGRPRLLLSMAVPAGIEYIDKGYDVPRLNDYLDFINLLSYDYHSAYEPAANHHSPLYPLEEDNEYNYDSELTIDYTIEHLLKSGATSQKIVLGIPTYGRSYTLFNEDATDIGAPADGPGEEGDATREKGYLAYYEICESIKKSDEWEVVQPNPRAMGPYAYRGNQWVGYDDEDIVRTKARYVNEKKLGGIMFWSIDNDDFRGKCHGRPYPLIEAAKETLLAGNNKKSNSGTRTRLSGKRPQRIKGNTIGRKLNAGGRTTEASSPRRASSSLLSSSRTNPRSNGRINGRGKETDKDDDDEKEEEEEEEGEEEEEVNAVKSVVRTKTHGKNGGRSRNRGSGGGRRKQHNEKKTDSSGNESRDKKFTTPEPPTTPDPGSDFKCEDEGFFSHPRDCKKYFWCLDSGPSGLGIVGHQFTCPSGLVFNKAADSCDYPRNVACPKGKSPRSTTARALITAATSRTTYLHKPIAPRTTTPRSEEEQYEYYDDDDDADDDDDDEERSEQVDQEKTRGATTAKPYKTINRTRLTSTTEPPPIVASTTSTSHKTTIDRVTSFEDEEDPRVIKELIDLIRKAGGIEQLEKQLHHQEKNSAGNAGITKEQNGRSTPATISRSLYERVLNRQATRVAGGFLGSLSTTRSSRGDKAEESAPKNARIGFVNGPGGAQFEGLDDVPEVKNLRTKHRYVTIERQRHSTSESPTDDDEEIDEEDNADVGSSEDQAVGDPPQGNKAWNRRVAPSYVNIRRPRPSETTRSENDVELKNGNENSEDFEQAEEEEEEEEEVTQRHRIVKNEEESPNPKFRYTNTQRFRGTTSRNSGNEPTERISVINDSSSWSGTTTDRIVPVREEISKISVGSPTTLEPSTSLESLIELDNSSSRTLEPEGTSSNPETTIVEIVEGSDILLTTIAASSTATTSTATASTATTESSDSESLTRRPNITAVSQPRPFGFSRRGRPMTSSSIMASVTEQTRTKVNLGALRLPTLKELVGLTTSLSSHDSTSAFTQSATIDINEPIKAAADEPNHLPEDGSKNFRDSGGPLESPTERQICDNDILGSEEIERNSESLVNEMRQIYPSSLSDESKAKREKTLKRIVEVPVKIFDGTNGEEIAELVLLRLPEGNLNSSILRPIFRVKIIDNDPRGFERTEDNNDDAKIEYSPESSLENQYSDNFRPTALPREINSWSGFGDAATMILNDGAITLTRNKKGQRIVKAREKSRVDPAATTSEDSDQGVLNVPAAAPDDQSTFRFEEQRVGGIFGIRENTEKSDGTTIVPQLNHNFSTTVRVTATRGNLSIPYNFSNGTHAATGFYVTRNIDDLIVGTTSGRNYDSSQEITTAKMNFTTQQRRIDETIPVKKNYSTAGGENSRYEIRSLMGLENSVGPANELRYQQQQRSTSVFETVVTPTADDDDDDDLTAVENEFAKLSGPFVATTEEKIIDETDGITTFRPWTSLVTRRNKKIFIETSEYSLDENGTEIGDKYRNKAEDETNDNVTESLETSPDDKSNSRSWMIIETAKGTIVPVKTAVSDRDEQRSQASRPETASQHGQIIYNEDNGKTISQQTEKSKITTTLPINTEIDKFDESNQGTASPSRESSSLDTGNKIEINASAQLPAFPSSSTEACERVTTAVESAAGLLINSSEKFTISREGPCDTQKPTGASETDKTGINTRRDELPATSEATTTEARDKTPEQLKGAADFGEFNVETPAERGTTVASRVNYPVRNNFVDSTESLSWENHHPEKGTSGSLESDDSRSNWTMEKSSWTERMIYDETMMMTTTTRTTAAQQLVDHKTPRNWIETNETRLDAVGNAKKIASLATTTTTTTTTTTETRRNDERVMTSKNMSDENNKLELSGSGSSGLTGVGGLGGLSGLYGTTSYEKNPTTIPSRLYAQRNDTNDDRKVTIIPNNATAEMESFRTKTESYRSTQFITDDVYTKINNQTFIAGEYIEEITAKIPASGDAAAGNEENYNETTTGQPADNFITAITASTIYYESRRKQTTGDTDARKKKIPPSEGGRRVFVTGNSAISWETVTPVYEKVAHSATDPSPINNADLVVTPVIEPRTKRTRGRVGLTNFAGNEANREKPRPVKQVLVRRRLANDRNESNLNESNLNESNLNESNLNESNLNESNLNESPEISVGNETNVHVQSEKIKNSSIKIQSNNKAGVGKNEEEEEEEEEEDYDKNMKKFENKLNHRSPEENIYSRVKSTSRRRVVVYRGRPRAETIPATPTTVPTFTNPGEDVNEDKRSKLRRKWRKRIVLKRSRTGDEGQDDQSIAETGDFRRALIGDFREELDGGAYLVVPRGVYSSSERISGEVNLLKSSGAFLRRPGTLIRNEALGRLRTKSSPGTRPGTSGTTTFPTFNTSPFSRIQSVKFKDEIKTDDQNVRAQELAVTLAEPPANRLFSTITAGRVGLRKKQQQRTTAPAGRKISTTVAPQTKVPTAAKSRPIARQRQQSKPRNENLRIVETPMSRPRRPAIIDYDYYVDDQVRLVVKPELKDKLFVTRKGGIRCLDQGNFAHPSSCKKFITCARMVNGQVIGTEYTCPDKLSFDPVGGICNWSAGLGCEEKSSN